MWFESWKKLKLKGTRRRNSVVQWVTTHHLTHFSFTGIDWVCLAHSEMATQLGKPWRGCAQSHRATDQTAPGVNWSPSSDSSALSLTGQPIKCWISEQQWEKMYPLMGLFSSSLLVSLSGELGCGLDLKTLNFLNLNNKRNILNRVRLIIIWLSPASCDFLFCFVTTSIFLIRPSGLCEVC